MLPSQGSSATSTRKKPVKLKKSHPGNPVPAYEVKQRAANERIHRGQIAETNRMSAAQRSGKVGLPTDSYSGAIGGAKRGETPTEIAVGQLRKNRQAAAAAAANKKRNSASNKKDGNKGKGGKGKGADGKAGRGGKGGGGGGGGKGGGGGGGGVTNPAATVAGTTDPYLDRARNAAAQIYNPQISALDRAQALAERQGRSGEQALTSMFAGLAKSGEQSGADISSIIQQATQGSTDRMAQLKSTLEGQYASQSASDAAALQKLGLAGTGTYADTARSTAAEQNIGQAGLQQQSMQNAMNLIGTGAQITTKEMAQGARNEGVSRTSDLAQQIRDQLTEYQGQRTSLSAAKASGIQELAEKYRQEGFSNEVMLQELGIKKQGLSADITAANRQSKEAAAKLLLDKGTAAQKAAADALKNAPYVVKLTADINKLKGKNESADSYLNILNTMASNPSVTSGVIKPKQHAQIPGLKPGERMTAAAAARIATYINGSLPKGKRVNPAVLRQLAIPYFQNMNK